MELFQGDTPPSGEYHPGCSAPLAISVGLRALWPFLSAPKNPIWGFLASYLPSPTPLVAVDPQREDRPENGEWGQSFSNLFRPMWMSATRPRFYHSPLCQSQRRSRPKKGRLASTTLASFFDSPLISLFLLLHLSSPVEPVGRWDGGG